MKFIKKKEHPQKDSRIIQNKNPNQNKFVKVLLQNPKHFPNQNKSKTTIKKCYSNSKQIQIAIKCYEIAIRCSETVTVLWIAMNCSGRKR